MFALVGMVGYCVYLCDLGSYMLFVACYLSFGFGLDGVVWVFWLVVLIALSLCLWVAFIVE